jgi:hypothetical protein
MHETRHQQPGIIAPCQPFRLFIACADQAGFLHAKRVQDRVEALCGNGYSRLLWNFESLHKEPLRGYAAREAAKSEMIVISLRAGGELPPHVKWWLESLPIRPQAGQAALVVLIDSKNEGGAEQSSSIADLRRIAQSRGLDFFCNQDKWAVPDGPKPVRQEKIISHRTPWTCGGIND